MGFGLVEIDGFDGGLLVRGKKAPVSTEGFTTKRVGGKIDGFIKKSIEEILLSK